MTAVLPFLSDEEIAALCAGLQLPAAQCRYLRDTLGLLVNRKPNGRPLVARSEFERVLGAGRFGAAQNDASAGPNVVGLNSYLSKRKPHGKTAQRR